MDWKARINGLIEHYDLKYKRLLKVREENYKSGYTDSVGRLDSRLHEIKNFLIELRNMKGG